MKVNKILLTTAVIASLGTTAFAADTTVGIGNGIAYGTATEAIGVKSIAIGNTVKASDDNSIAIGYDASAKGINAIAIGSSQITNSSENPDTKTLVDGENSLAIGQAAQVTSNDSIAIGKDSKVYDSSNISTVVGYGAKSSAYMGSAFGANAHAGGSSSFAMGSLSEALGDNSVAIGQQAKAEKTDSYALGSGAEATNYYSSALGSNSHATGNGATAIGTASTANGDNSVAIGSYAVTKGENNITLGYHSVDDNIVATSHSLINGHDYKFAGDDPYGTVSVGGVVDYDFVKDADGNPVLNEDGTGYLMVKKHLTRTITNVAAGRISDSSTDAINGSQLHAIIEEANKIDAKVNNHETRINDISAKVDKNKEVLGNHEGRITTLENKITDIGTDAINQANHYTDMQVAKVGANAAALAALHPLDYNPDHKTDIMAGVGHYKGKTAVALGVSHRPNENTMVTFGTTINGKDTMVNAGVSYKVGSKGSTYKSPLKMAKEIDDLKAIVDKLLKDNQELHKALENK